MAPRTRATQERDPLVRAYVHLNRERRAEEALGRLKRVASLVTPIMRSRAWTVGQLAEFYPQNDGLLGLNVNRGSKICLRLRYSGDRNQFLPLESVVDTMLHELCHIEHGPHNGAFHALWDQLRDELQGLLMKGYTGQGFLSEGRPLGGRRIPEQEVRRLAREAAEGRRRQSSASVPGRRLGGAAPRPGQQLGRLMADAAERRRAVLRGCGTARLSEAEGRALGEAATSNGFRTRAEEDEANELAIAQALWELAREEEAGPLSSASDTAGPGGGSGGGGGGGAGGEGADDLIEVGDSASSTTEEEAEPGSWLCELCTLRNRPLYLCCEACGGERREGKRRRTGPAKGWPAATAPGLG